MFSTTTGTVNQFTCSKYVDNYSFDIPFFLSFIVFFLSLDRLSLPRAHVINTRTHARTHPAHNTPTPTRAHTHKKVSFFLLFFFFISATSLLTTSRVRLLTLIKPRFINCLFLFRYPFLNRVSELHEFHYTLCQYYFGCLASWDYTSCVRGVGLIYFWGWLRFHDLSNKRARSPCPRSSAIVSN